MDVTVRKPRSARRAGRLRAGALLIGMLLVTMQAGFPPGAAAIGWTANRWPVERSGSMSSVSIDQSVEGKFTIVIPAGMNATMLQSGMNDYGLPAVIKLRVGDVITIENRDDVPHAILYTVVNPGQTDIRTITRAGSEMYSAGCGASAGAAGFTSIFIADR